MSVKQDQTVLRTRCAGTTLEVTAAIPETPARSPTSRPERGETHLNFPLLEQCDGLVAAG